MCLLHVRTARRIQRPYPLFAIFTNSTVKILGYEPGMEAGLRSHIVAEAAKAVTFWKRKQRELSL